MATAACDTFFATPELVYKLASTLCKKELSKLMQTNRQMYSLFSHSFFRTLDLVPLWHLKSLSLDTSETLAAIVRNAHHVRVLKAGSAFIVAYYNGLWNPQGKDSTVCSDTVPSGRAVWAPAPDPQHRLPVPFPPLTNLTKLELNMNGQAWIKPTSGSVLDGNNNPSPSLLQVCQLIQLNPALVVLSLEGITIENEQEIQVLASVINGSRNLKHLGLIFLASETQWPRLPNTLFWACPTSLKSLNIYLDDEGERLYDDNSDDDNNEEEEVLDDDEEPERLEPLELPAVEGKHDTLGEFIGRTAPNITTLHHGTREYGHDGGLIMGIMSTLPEHQLEDLSFLGFYEFDAHAGDLAAAIQRHSASLTEIRIKESERMLSKSIQTILQRCEVLEVLEIKGSCPFSHSISLGDAVESEWACTGLKELSLAVSIGKGGERAGRHRHSIGFDEFSGSEDGSNSGSESESESESDSDSEDLEFVGAWMDDMIGDDSVHAELRRRPDDYKLPGYVYNRQAMFSRAERKRGKLLEAFYRQLAALSDLEALHLRAIHDDINVDSTEIGSYQQTTRCDQALFPFMLSLGGVSKAQPGYLSLFKGWKKLKALHGSVSLHTEEACLTIGQDEMEWMVENWPQLQHEGFGPWIHEPKRKCYVWLLKHHDGLRSLMDSACDKVFAIPELVHKLATNLTQGELSNLMQTSHRLHAFCVAAFYQHMNCHTGPLLDSPDALVAFARNVQHVRSLDTGRAFSVYYFNAVLAFHHMVSGILGQGKAAFCVPTWIPPPDPQPCLLIPFPPMTHLTHLSVQIGLDYVQDGFEGECFLDKYETTNHVTQVCWILHLNPNLVQVSIFGIPTKSIEALYILAKAITKLNRLKKLLLGLIGREVLWTLLSYSYFLACPRSIQALAVMFEESTGDDNEEGDDGNGGDGDDDEEFLYVSKALEIAIQKIVSWDVNHEGARELHNLTFLTLENLAYLTTEEVCELFADCPNLEQLTLPFLGSAVDIVTVGRTIGKGCPKLTGMISKGFVDDRRQTLVLEIMESMVAAPALEKFVSVGTFEMSSRLSTAFRRHATALTWVQFDFNKEMVTPFIQLVLFECPSLEMFILGGGARWRADGPALTVSEVVERKWASSRIKELNLRISLGHLAFSAPVSPDAASLASLTASPAADNSALAYASTGAASAATSVADSNAAARAAGVKEEVESSEPYYLRRTPILLTEQEQRQMTVLEKFYKQLGVQTELEVLELWRIEPTSDDVDPLRDLTFPALLSLGDPVAGRPGFLGLWSKLKKLRSLHGSFSSYTEENRVIFGMKEVQWLAEAWPALEEADFCPEPLYGEDELLPHFKWLNEVRPEILLS
ncbi:hypothetical protein BG015_001769 [Linnemannia schmuckeri]|uniref:Uncharacterized protein n=1 Tax=Linnemannia schmuckeri TaxID=64567 RepID=A0A9P5S3R1_9FUNG|nr:hypothetical protein BG015_001769 [Linnemannia schmuckeri]